MIQIIAEIGSVHDGSLGNAFCLIEAAAKAGATAVKFQTHIAQAETLPSAPSPHYFNTETRFEYFTRTSFSLEEWKLIASKCEEHSVQFLSSPFSIEAAELLLEVGVQGLKIPSGEVSNTPLLEKLADMHLPILLSSGMSDWREIDNAVNILANQCELTIMQCTSAYPCNPERVGLNIIKEMLVRYNQNVGFSDHTMGFAAPLAAVCMGATVIEKHFTFSRLMYGSDAKHSMEPTEFLEMTRAIGEVATMLENPIDKDDLSGLKDMKKIFEKSIVIGKDMAAEEVIAFDVLSFKKPGDGIPASEYKQVLGKKIKSALPANHQLSWTDLF